MTMLLSLYCSISQMTLKRAFLFFFRIIIIRVISPVYTVELLKFD